MIRFKSSHKWYVVGVKRDPKSDIVKSRQMCYVEIKSTVKSAMLLKWREVKPDFINRSQKCYLITVKKCYATTVKSSQKCYEVVVNNSQMCMCFAVIIKGKH